MISAEHKDNIIPKAEFYDETDSDNVCIFCENPNYKTLYVVKHYGFKIRFQKCRCGLIKQTPMPNETFFSWFFNSKIFLSAKQENSEKIWGYYDFFKDESCRLATSQLRFKKLCHLFKIRKPINIIKIGPATGTFLYIANQHKLNAIGCDVSSQFIEFAKKNYNVRIDHGRFEKLDYVDGQFDVVLLFNVIENIPNVSEFLSTVKRRVKIGGYFILNFVDMTNNLIEKFQKDRYFLYRPPVCYIYQKEVLSKLLLRYDLKPVNLMLDIRYIHMEKILTLLQWKYIYKIIRPLKIHRIPFPIYAYPSKIIVARRVK